MNHNYDWKYLLSRRGIYQIRQLSTGKVYIGSTTQNFYDRMCAHHSTLRRGVHSSIYLQRAWDKHGSSDFEFMILLELVEITNILCIELAYINKYKSSDAKFGFNMAKEVSPNRLGHKQSEETRHKISQKIKGIKRSSETCQKMGAAKRGKNSPMFGKKQSPELIARRLRNNYCPVKRSDGRTYYSLIEAAADIGCLPQSVSQSLRKGCRCAGFYFYYLEMKHE